MGHQKKERPTNRCCAQLSGLFYNSLLGLSKVCCQIPDPLNSVLDFFDGIIHKGMYILFCFFLLGVSFLVEKIFVMR